MANDRLRGGTADDLIAGHQGSDHLVGGAGNDTLVGGAGDDRMFGGTGNDAFVFNRMDDGGAQRDVIADFGLGDDVLVFQGYGQRELSYSQQGDNVSVRVGGLAATGPDAIEIILLNTDISSISAADFVFA
jgi:Ca2+-binding RTX toxin-like protein